MGWPAGYMKGMGGGPASGIGRIGGMTSEPHRRAIGSLRAVALDAPDIDLLAAFYEQLAGWRHLPDDDEDDWDDDEGAPPPLQHATPDVELAEEQLAFARPAEPEPEDEADEEEYEREVEESIAESGGGGRGGRRRRGGGYDGGGAARGSGGAGELAVPGAAAPERAPSVFARLIAFLQGSWRELQRVQWPDRRQVFQATGVVIGFVIVAAVFLGVADWVAGKLVTFVLK